MKNKRYPNSRKGVVLSRMIRNQGEGNGSLLSMSIFKGDE
jgi:hypothetical protein